VFKSHLKQREKVVLTCNNPGLRSHFDLEILRFPWFLAKSADYTAPKGKLHIFAFNGHKSRETYAAHTPVRETPSKSLQHPKGEIVTHHSKTARNRFHTIGGFRVSLREELHNFLNGTREHKWNNRRWCCECRDHKRLRLLVVEYASTPGRLPPTPGKGGAVHSAEAPSGARDGTAELIWAARGGYNASATRTDLGERRGVCPLNDGTPHACPPRCSP